MSEALLYGKEEVNALDKIYGEYHKRTTSTRYQLAVLRKQSKYMDSLHLFLQV